MAVYNSRAAFQTRFTRTMSKEQRFLVHPTLPTRCEGKDIIVFPPTDTLVLAFIVRIFLTVVTLL